MLSGGDIRRKNTVNDNDNSDDIDDEVEDFTDF